MTAYKARLRRKKARVGQKKKKQQAKAGTKDPAGDESRAPHDAAETGSR